MMILPREVLWEISKWISPEERMMRLVIVYDKETIKIYVT